MPTTTSASPKKNLNITLLGSPSTGKTALLTTHLFNVFPSYYTPTLDGVFSSPTPSQTLTFLEPGSIDNLLQLRLPSTDVFVIVFSLVDKRTFEEAETKWSPLSRSIGGNPKPVVLVGCKKDLRPVVLPLKEEIRREVMEHEGERMAWRIKARTYYECSALTEEGVGRVFEAVVRVGEGK